MCPSSSSAYRDLAAILSSLISSGKRGAGGAAGRPGDGLGGKVGARAVQTSRRYSGPFPGMGGCVCARCLQGQKLVCACAIAALP